MVRHMRCKLRHAAVSKYSQAFAAKYLIWQSTELERESRPQFTSGTRKLKQPLITLGLKREDYLVGFGKPT